METGARVRLITFNGSGQTPTGCNSQENYWVLIGHKGTVLGFNSERRRYLVQFDCALADFGLHCHNDEPNSLYILASDLMVVKGAFAP